MTRIPQRLAATAAVALTVLGAIAAPASPALAAYPDKPITMVVPFAAGGPTDKVARALGTALEAQLGQPVVVENKPSAGGIVAPAEISRAEPDGYKLLIHHIGMATAPALYRKLNYNPLTDFEHLGLVNAVPMTLVTRPDFPAKDLQGLVKHVKANAEKINLAHAGLGAASHLCGLIFQQSIDTALTTIPYKGTGPAMTQLLAGETDLMCDQTTSTTPNLKAGKIKAYAVTASQRVPSLNDIPTAKEGGLPALDLSIWHGLYAPKGTPAAVTKRLNDALVKALDDPQFQKAMANDGAVVWGKDMRSREAHTKLITTETARWTKVIQAAGQFAD